MKKFKYCLLPVVLAIMSCSAMAADHGFGADRHVAKGVPCQACHGPDMKNPQEPTIDTCVQCHNKAALVAKTAKVQPHNPHTSPHYDDNLDCVNCHYMHEKPENFCNQCHEFDFKVK